VPISQGGSRRASGRCGRGSQPRRIAQCLNPPIARSIAGSPNLPIPSQSLNLQSVNHHGRSSATIPLHARSRRPRPRSRPALRRQPLQPSHPPQERHRQRVRHHRRAAEAALRSHPEGRGCGARLHEPRAGCARAAHRVAHPGHGRRYIGRPSALRSTGRCRVCSAGWWPGSSLPGSEGQRDRADAATLG